MTRHPIQICSLWLLLAGFLGAWMGSGQARAADPPARPNILFIAIDDLNDWVGALGGYADVKTPNLDRLAKRSVVFTRAYAAAPACNPSRAALLTGRRPSTSGVYHNDQPWRPVLPDAVTLPQHFRANGYQVMGGGKIFHGGFNDRASWDEYRAKYDSPIPKGRPLNGIPHAAQFDWGPVNVPDEKMGDYKIADWAIKRLSASQPDPFFLALGFTRPHLPWYVPQRYFDQYPLSEIKLPKVKPDDLDDVPVMGRQMARPEGDHRRVVEWGEWQRAVQGYLASISFADAMLGRVLDALERSPHARNTIVVVWGDHGWHLGEKQHWRKFTLWEEATRAPLFIAGPGIKPGVSGRPVSLMDLYPTLAELGDLPPRSDVEGHSLVPLLREPSAEWKYPALTTHGKGNHAVRSERWRYIRYADGSEELYDHREDPLEWKNLASDPDHAKTKAELARSLPPTNAPDAPGTRSDDD